MQDSRKGPWPSNPTLAAHEEQTRLVTAEKRKEAKQELLNLVGGLTEQGLTVDRKTGKLFWQEGAQVQVPVEETEIKLAGLIRQLTDADLGEVFGQE